MRKEIDVIRREEILSGAYRRGWWTPRDVHDPGHRRGGRRGGRRGRLLLRRRLLWLVLLVLHRLGLQG
ncbi:hypothetical protein ACFC0C_17390, partial [Streptomyces sp. NPDC056178]|uniref:hypothetical protein n=1 Tax=Streptomyces sp. NPDC056178 TaxID=3345735 RepID=UPI0035DF4880